MSGWPRGKPRGPISPAHRRKIRGERSGAAKLTRPQVEEIWAALQRGEPGPMELARRHDVSHTAIWMIANGHTWTHVTGLPRVPYREYETVGDPTP